MNAEEGPRFVNVAAYLPAVAQSRPNDVALAWPEKHTGYSKRTYAELNVSTDRLVRGLGRLGIVRGMRTVLMAPPSVQFFELTFALFKIGAVPVLIDPGMGVRNLGRCFAEAAPEAFIGTPKAHLARNLLRWARSTVRITVSVGRQRLLRLAKNVYSDVMALGERSDANFSPAEVAAGETAAILFTSGSTGPAKGAVYTHGMFASQIQALRRMFDIRPGEIDLCTFPLFALFAPALGMTAIIPEMDATRPARVSPRAIFEPVQRWSVTNLFGSPALLNTISRAAEQRHVTLPSIKRVISAGAPVPAAVIERVTQMLAPGVPVFTPYGATECLPVACIDSATILGETRHETDRGRGICVGRPVPEIEAAIIPVSLEPIEKWNDELRQPVNTVGEITVHGPFVSPAYFGRPEATRLAKIDDGRGGVWHRMGDLGYIDEHGRLWFCGRKAHRVETSAGPLDTIPCEAVFNTHPAVFRTALVGVGQAGNQTPVLCVELENSRFNRLEVTRELLALGERFAHTKTIRTILYHRRFPVDVRHNAKIGREQLAAWAHRKLRSSLSSSS